jgi:hypothetical protein
LFLLDEETQNFLPLSRPQFSSIIKYYSQQLNINRTKFAVEVCDNYNYCQMFNASNYNVVKTESTDSLNGSEIINNALFIARRHWLTGDPISALTLLISPLINQSLSENELILRLTVEYSAKISSENIRFKGDLTFIYYAFGEILKKTNNFYIKFTVIEILRKLSQTTQIIPDLQSLGLLYTNVLNFYKFEKTISQKFNYTYGYYSTVNETQIHRYFSNIRHVFLYILKSVAKQIPIGKYIKLGDKLEFPEAITLITNQKRFYQLKLDTKFSHWQNVSTFVKFNDHRIFKYLNKISPESENTTHNSMVYAITLFPSDSPFQFDENVHRLTPIVDISIHSPIDGEKIQVFAEKFDYIAIMKVTLIGNQTFGGSEYTTKCHFYNEIKGEWETEGVTELGISGSSGGCLMHHLSSFIILRVIEKFSVDYFFGVIVAAMMGILIFGIMVVFFVQKKDDFSSRVAPTSYNYRR